MILRLLVGAAIGGGVAWYNGARDKTKLARSAGIGAGVMLLAPLLTAGSSTSPFKSPSGYGGLLTPKGASYFDTGGYGWHFDSSRGVLTTIASPTGKATVLRKGQAGFEKVFAKVVKGKPARKASEVVANAEKSGGQRVSDWKDAYTAVVGQDATAYKQGKSFIPRPGQGTKGAETEAVSAPAPAVETDTAGSEGDVLDKAAASLGVTRTQLLIGGGVLVGGIVLALVLGRRAAPTPLSKVAA